MQAVDGPNSSQLEWHQIGGKTNYGFTCMVCGFNFSATFGSRGSDYIHVHHLVPLSEIRENYVVDPINDLNPVCPNCHAMIHRYEPMLKIDELKLLLHEMAQNNAMHPSRGSAAS